LAQKIKEHGANAWLVNTGWTGGPYGIGSRFKLKYTRAIIDAIHDGSLDQSEMIDESVFGLKVPLTCPNVPTDLLQPKSTWVDKKGYDNTLNKLAELFKNNFKKYEKGVNKEIISAGPK
jgi:phosphoenolpyruvate carboxykinase (ATP)